MVIVKIPKSMAISLIFVFIFRFLCVISFNLNGEYINAKLMKYIIIIKKYSVTTVF